MIRHAALALIVVVGLGACNGGGDPAPEPTDAATDPSPTKTPRQTASPPTGGSLPAGWALCVDEEQGYEIGYPESWHTEAENLEDQCRLFDPDPFEVEPRTELPVTAMMVHHTRMSFDRASEEWFDEDTYEVTLRAKTTVARRPAFRYERIQRRGALYPDGTTYYGYLVDRAGDAFYVQTVELPTGDRNRQRFREVVDQAVTTLAFTSPVALREARRSPREEVDA